MASQSAIVSIPWTIKNGCSSHPRGRHYSYNRASDVRTRRKARWVDKMAEGVTIGLSGPSPSFLKLGVREFLGEFTDEMDGDVIVEFCSGGAKNDGYLTKKGKTECKVRGCSLNYETKQVLNYHTMKELDEPLEKPRRMAITIPDDFQRDPVTKKIKLTERKKKHYQLVFDKRVIDPATRSSTPYGYTWLREDIDLLLDL